jgi:hypothetical protein
MIKYDPSIPFVQHFGIYQIPETMADAIEQFRLDRLRTLLDTHRVSNDVFELLATGDDSEVDNFGELCDPLGYFGDTSQNRIKSGQTATLPPVPSMLADLGVGGSDMWQINLVPKGLLTADDATVAIIASLVAASFCDPSYSPSDRPAAIRYITINNVDHPASKILRESNLWQSHRRTIEIPDMIVQRKADFVQLFIDRGMALEPRELECLSQQDLIDCATDMRFYVLERNRHVVFCKRCSSAMLFLNSQTMAPTQGHVC